MEKINLEDKLNGLHIPEPGDDRRSAAMKAALSEFELGRREAEKKVKGFEEAERLTGIKAIISLFKGGPVMNRPLVVSAGVAMLALLLTLSLVPQYMKKSGVVPLVNERVEETTKSQPSSDRQETGRVVGTDKKDPGTKQLQRQEAVIETKKDRIALPQVAPPPVAHQGEDVMGGKAEKQTLAAEEKPAEDRIVLNKMKEMDALSIHPAPRMMAEAKAKSEAVMGMSQPSPGIVAVKPAPTFRAGEEAYPHAGAEYAGRDKFDHSTPNPVKVAAEEPVSTFSIDVDTSSYAFVRRAVNSGHLPQKDAVRIEEMINYFKYDYEVPGDRSRPFKPTVAVYPTPWNPGTRLLHIGIKGYDIVKKERPRANLVFLVDVSGSMSSPDKLPLLKNSLKMLVEELGPEDTVAIAVYAGSAGTVLEPTRIKEKGKIIAALERLSAGGSTAGGEGIRLAYALAEGNFDPKAVNRVILATDGDFNVGIQNPEELKGFVERKRKTGIYLSVLGFGQGNYNDALMQKLAQNGNGNAAYIDTLNEARKVLVEEAGSTLFTIAKDVKIQVEFNPDKVSEYRLIGYESRMLRREDFNNDQVDAGDIGAGHTVTAIYEITTVNSSSKLVDELRYKKQGAASKKGPDDEFAFLKMRYKLPEEEQSRLITVPIDRRVEYAGIEKVPADLRFASAVAAFGQILRGDPYVKGFGYDDVIRIAEPARGRDEFGYRSEFINLVRLAKTAGDMGNR